MKPTPQATPEQTPAQASKRPAGAPIHVGKKIAWALLKSLILPLIVLIFFLCAPHWLEYRINTATYNSIVQDPKLSPSEKQAQIADLARINFQLISSDDCPPEYSDAHADLVENGTAGNFERLAWGLDLSIILVAVLLGAALIIFLLNLLAKKSQEKLIVTYRLGSRIATAASLINVSLLLPLLAYGSFEFSCLLFDQYSVKLLALIILAGVFALWSSIAILFKKVPLEFDEPMARELTPEEAPELWQVVRDAAARLQTAPPDRIIAGLDMKFYVTEMVVKLVKGRVEGRTLYLSYPLLKQLSEDEVLAIIGHELGHFIGKDTALTRDFFPMQYKVRQTMQVLAGALLIGEPSLQLLTIFYWCFEGTVQTASRERELLADSVGASLTSPHVMARSLVKYHVVLEIFQRTMAETIRGGTHDPLNFDLKAGIRQNLASDSEFWSHLFEKTLPHPLDSHPSLQDRLEGLGQTVSPADAQAMALEEGRSAHAGWLAERDHLFTELSTEAQKAIEKMREKIQVVKADPKTEEGKALLERHFPEVVWPTKPIAVWTPTIILGPSILVCVLVIFLLPNWPIRLILGLSTLFLGFVMYVNFKTHYNGKFTLNSTGVSYSSWKRPLLFEDMEGISMNGSSLVFHFKAAQKNPSRYTMNRLNGKTVSFPLSVLQGKTEVLAQTIFRYLTRQAE